MLTTDTKTNGIVFPRNSTTTEVVNNCSRKNKCYNSSSFNNSLIQKHCNSICYFIIKFNYNHIFLLLRRLLSFWV